ncbi:hypothetical protein CF067_00800 [Clostridium sporogenes]
MSVVICYNTNDLSLVVTDTRITCSDGKFTDNNEKLVKLPIGWCAGVGASGFLDEIKDKLIANNINVECDIINAYNEVYNNYNNSVYTEEQIDMSALIVSYLANNKFETVILNNKCIRTNKYIYTNNYVNIAEPIELIEEEFLNNDYKKNFPLVEIKCKHRAIKRIFQIFNYISYNCMSVSKIYDIGVMYLNNGNIHRCRFTGNIEKIISKSYKKIRKKNNNSIYKISDYY